MVVFAIEISDAHSKSRREITVQVHQRAVLGSALINGLYQSSLEGQIPSYTQLYGGSTVDPAVLDAQAKSLSYDLLAVLAPDGSVIAASSRFDGSALTNLHRSHALDLLRKGHPYGQGDEVPFGTGRTADLAVDFRDQAGGGRILVIGFQPSILHAFLTGTLTSIPGVAGASNYVVDSNGVVIASSDPSARIGMPITRAGALRALKAGRGDFSGTYFDSERLDNSTWSTLLASPDGPLFASVTGLRQALPWIVFGAFVVVAALALLLGLRTVESADRLRDANDRLETSNRDLARVNNELERRAAELARSNEELDRFASIASHDLQEPLRKVRTFTEQLVVTEGDQLSERGRDYLRRANSAAARMQSLVEDLLRFSRVSTQGRPFEPVDLGHVARGVIEDLSAQIGDASAVVDVGPLPTIDADAHQMRQLLQNLISNAVKFRKETVPPRVEVAARTDGPMVLLTVADNGIGFDPRYESRIFRIFERLHGRTEYEGTGIGLALCRKIADRHGGSIEAEGELGVGSTFTIHLPMRQGGDTGHPDEAPVGSTTIDD